MPHDLYGWPTSTTPQLAISATCDAIIEFVRVVLVDSWSTATS